MKQFVSVVVPCRNEVKYISVFLEGIIAMDYDKANLEMFIVDGQSTDGTQDIVSQYSDRYPHIKLLNNPQRTAPCALNLAIKESKGDTIIRMDVHSIYPSDYISKLIHWQDKLGADNVGGLCATSVLYKTKTSIAIAKVMNNKFGVGNSAFRTNVNQVKEVDTVPFGCFKRSVFDNVGYFDERLTRNQDIEFNKRIKRSGGSIMIVPEITCSYIPRDNYKAFAQNRYMTGLWIINTSFYTKTLKNLSLRHFIPCLFVCSLFGSLFLGVFMPVFLYLFGFVVSLYLSLVFYQSIKVVNKETSILHIVAAFLVLHFSYGFGSIVGLWNNLLRKNSTLITKK